MNFDDLPIEMQSMIFKHASVGTSGKLVSRSSRRAIDFYQRPIERRAVSRISKAYASLRAYRQKIRSMYDKLKLRNPRVSEANLYMDMIAMAIHDVKIFTYVLDRPREVPRRLAEMVYHYPKTRELFQQTAENMTKISRFIFKMTNDRSLQLKIIKGFHKHYHISLENTQRLLQDLNLKTHFKL